MNDSTFYFLKMADEKASRPGEGEVAVDVARDASPIEERNDSDKDPEKSDDKSSGDGKDEKKDEGSFKDFLVRRFMLLCVVADH